MRKIKWIAFIPAVLILVFINTGFADGSIAAGGQTVFEDGANGSPATVLQNEDNLQKPGQQPKTENKDGPGGCGHDKSKKDRFRKGIASLYGEMTNRTPEDVLKACSDNKMSVWELALKEGNLEKLKTAFIAHVKEKLSQMVKEGKISQEEMQKKLDRIQKKLSQTK